MTESALLGMAANNKTLSMVDAFRSLAKVDEEVWETPSRTFGGSFRYWRRDTDNADRMMFGVNVSGNRRKVPNGQFDIWIPVGTFQKVFGVSEKQSRGMLKQLKGSQIVGKDCIVRVSSTKAASA